MSAAYLVLRGKWIICHVCALYMQTTHTGFAVHGFKQQALTVSTDPEHRFELALQLGELKIAYQLAVEAEVCTNLSFFVTDGKVSRYLYVFSVGCVI